MAFINASISVEEACVGISSDPVELELSACMEEYAGVLKKTWLGRMGDCSSSDLIKEGQLSMLDWLSLLICAMLIGGCCIDM